MKCVIGCEHLCSTYDIHFGNEVFYSANVKYLIHQRLSVYPANLKTQSISGCPFLDHIPNSIYYAPISLPVYN